ncbi:hypothetical protein OHA25_40185 [Nonomuraea sp. NBC_00507]|uniref:hypothetical protein n=1 Tax=Nonomuraea sp. NBC_00507 TaxID=2976002 RepID=UPI002E181A0C
MQRLFLAPLVITALWLTMQQGASAALRAWSPTADYSGDAEYWDTIPYTTTPGHYYTLNDYDADGYGIRMRYQTTVTGSIYIDYTGGVGSQSYNASSLTTAIQTCNRDKLSNGSISVFNCGTWSYA